MRNRANRGTFQVVRSKMKNHVFNMVAVFEKELYTTPPLIPVVVGTIIGTRKDVPKVFQAIKDLADPGELKHLKRIKDLPNGDMECIICSCSQTSQGCAENKEKLQRIEKFHTPAIFRNCRIVDVPESAPQTEQQLKACREIWPCKYAKCNYLIRCLDGTVISELERLVVQTIVDRCIDLIESNENPTSSAAVVFRYSKVYGIGLSNELKTVHEPEKHAVMLAIDNVAKNLGSGYWKSEEGDELTDSIQKCLDQKGELLEHKMDADFLPYLCTNYDAFVTEEPCFMCVMGLVQSRIRRLFYLDAESIDRIKNCQKVCYQDNAIEKFTVHRLRHLNHRFEAWKLTLVS